MGFEGFSVGDYALVCDSLDEFVAQSELDVVAITSRIEECRKRVHPDVLEHLPPQQKPKSAYCIAL